MPGGAISSAGPNGTRRITALAAVAVPVAVWAALIFAMSTEAFSRANSEAWVAWSSAAFGLHLDEGRVAPVLTTLRSTAHFVEFFVLVRLVDRALAKLTALSPLSSAACAVAFAATYALLDELHQRFVQGRSSSPNDWVIDVLGGSLAGLLIVARANRSASRELIPSNRGNHS